MLYNIVTCFDYLKLHFPNVTYSSKLPQQIVIKHKTFSLVLFNSGQLRIMGKATYNIAYSFLKSIKLIYSHVITDLHLTSQTVVFKLMNSLCPINLITFVKEYSDDVNIKLNSELFPAVSLHHWKPIHVNLFSSGKIVVLGKNALQMIPLIDEWIFFKVLLLPK